MSETDSEKQLAAHAAAELVEPGMTVGLGSGSTANFIVKRLGERVEAGLRFAGVATSRATADLARRCAIPLIDLDSVDWLDLDLDGADEVDSQFRLIKGRGGAMLREKIVASAARRRVMVVTADKLVDRLGRHFPVPVEVSPFGIKHTEHAIRNLGGAPTLRAGADGTVYKTDEGHHILDCRFEEIADPEELDQRLRSVVGVFETGLFIELCDLVIVGDSGGVRRLVPPGHASGSR
jgi:ribose 5-phosphate isomerase A